MGREVVEDKVLSCKSGVSRDRGAITLEKAGAGKGVHVAAGSENKEEYEKCSLVALLLWCAAVVCSCGVQPVSCGAQPVSCGVQPGSSELRTNRIN